MGLLEASSRLYTHKHLASAVSHVRSLEDRLKAEVKKNERLQHQLTKAPETGLPNSLVMHAELNLLLKKDASRKAVMFIAMNDIFGMLKKTFSTKIPEWVLYQTAQRLIKAVGRKGRVYHTHEEEFLVLLENIGDHSQVFGLARHINELLEKSHVMGGYTIALGFNMGIAFYPDHGDDKATLLRAADIALAEAVKGKKPFYLFSPQLKEWMREQVELRNGILTALESQSTDEAPSQLELAFQPQVKIHNWKSGNPVREVVGAETLIRWRHPTLGLVPPSKFIPVAEESGLIIPLSRWILHTSLSHYAELQGLGFDNVSLSVNLSALQLASSELVQPLYDSLVRRNLPTKHFKLEVTEGGLIENFEVVSEHLKSLRELGFPILVDDFGTGYSSLSYLKRLPVDVLKIDKSFIDGLPEDKANASLVRAILTMAEDLGLDTIVEGTENQTQVDWLYDHGCTTFQGYFFSKPLRFPDFLKFLRAHRTP